MSHKKLRPFIVKVSVLGYFPLYSLLACCLNIVFMTLILFRLQKYTMGSTLSFLVPSPKLPVTPALFLLPNLAFQPPITYMMSSFGVISIAFCRAS